MEEIIVLNLWQIISAYVFVIIALIIVRIKKIPREKLILFATFRMTLQLVAIGYLLVYVFSNINIFYTITIIMIMEIFAIRNVIKRAADKISLELRRIIIFSMLFGTLLTIFYFIIIVIKITPWYDPRYFIPIAGMIIGNSMTGITLAVKYLIDNITLQKDKIEGSLMLGATPKVACKKIVNSAFDSAILPTINSMMGMGIIFLPGMMTGQILSGVSPVISITYQIAIMLGILGSVSLVVMLFLHFGYKTFFNNNAQLIIE